jgi:hypothetical protein
MENESGIYPCGNRVLVHADQIEEKLRTLLLSCYQTLLRHNRPLMLLGH